MNVAYLPPALKIAEYVQEILVIENFRVSSSFVIECENQEEIDYYWEKLTADGGAESSCGWLKDKFDVSWQVVPAILPKLLSNPEKAQRVMEAFMKMKKFDIATLENA